MYDFMNDELPDEERVPYKVMRWWVLDCYYRYCRSKIRYNNHWHKGWVKYEHELGYAYEQYEHAFQTPIEQLMLEVLTLILGGGRGPDTVEPYHRAKIAEILEKHALSEMLNALPGEELDEFEQDLKLLKLM